MALIAKITTRAELRGRRGAPLAGIELLGLLSVDDGEGGLYHWDDISTIPDDGFGVIQVTGVATGRWIRQFDISDDATFTNDYFDI